MEERTTPALTGRVLGAPLEGVTARVIGIDTAKWQGALDWPDLVARLGIGFGIAKAQHGVGGVDPQFVASWRGMRGLTVTHREPDTNLIVEAPFRRGAYLWLVPTQDPARQAEAFVATLEKAGPLDRAEVPLLMLDNEQPSDMRGRALVDAVLTCLRRIAELTAVRPLHYTGEWYWQGYCGDLDDAEIATYPLVLAAYPNLGKLGPQDHARALALFDPAKTVAPRPYRSRGIGPAISQFDGDRGLYLPDGTDADFDAFNGDLAALDAFVRSLDLRTRDAGGTLPDDPPHDPYYVDRAEAEAVEKADEDPPKV